MGKEKRRENWIDVAKGIAMLLIIIGHTGADLEGWWSISWVYGVHVIMFFLLSGYTFKVRGLTKEYVNSRFTRLMVPYFVTCFAVMAMDFVNCRISSGDFTIDHVTHVIGRDLVRSFFASGTITTFGSADVGSRIGAIWFLPALFFATMLVQLVLNKVTDVKQQGVIFGLLAVTAYITKDFFWLPFSIQSGMMGALFIWTGYLVRTRGVLDRMKWYHYLAALVVYIWGYVNQYAFASLVRANLADLFLSFVVGLCGCLLIVLLSQKLENRKGFLFIGRNSLTILCTHLFALETMGSYFTRCLNHLPIAGNVWRWGFIILEILFAVVTAFLIVEIKKGVLLLREKIKKRRGRDAGSILPAEQNRDAAVDVARGILIIAMIIGHFQIDSGLRAIIYSCHMVAFIFLSGYFYSPPKSIPKAVRHMAKTFLVPYAVFVGLYLMMNYSRWSSGFFREAIVQHLMGISFARRIFADIPSVGPVYFILLLFVTRLIYMLLDRVCQDEKKLTVVVIVLSLVGVAMGRKGIWMPWSVDIALYGLVYYHIGVLFRQYHLLDRVLSYSCVYFILSSIWAYMIYAGSMEIAIRNYGSYGLVILGSVSGILIVMQLSSYIRDKLPVLCSVFCLLGRNSIYIIICHVLLNSLLKEKIGNYLDTGFFPYMAVSMAIQLAAGAVIGECIHMIKNRHMRPAQRGTVA